MQKKVTLKLVAMALLLLVSIVTVVSASYAWLTMSDNPTANGIQITLSGGTTILIAPDVTQQVNGVTYHYPGRFSDTLDFGNLANYDYLQNLSGLTPVSTADGIHWFMASYYDAEDELVKQGLVSAGSLRPFHDFALDDALVYANQPAGSEMIAAGHYVYLDFWVVAPGADYQLRISTSEDAGSFVIDLLDPVLSGQTITGYTLQNNGITSTSASVRVGFLTSRDLQMDDAMALYQQTADYDSRFTALRGIYPEKGSPVRNPEDYSFLIYEPNADAHPTGAAENGAYVATCPLESFNGVANPVGVLDRTTVQLTNWWSSVADGSSLLVEQMFQTALHGKSDYEAAANTFYTEYLQGQFHSLINRGSFIRSSAVLQDYISAERMQTLEKSTATDDVYIVELERNVPQRIRMFIWLEGQDVDWDPSGAGRSFAVSLEFAGSSR